MDIFDALTVCKIVPDTKRPEEPAELDERLLATPSIALERCRAVAADMARTAADALRESIASLRDAFRQSYRAFAAKYLYMEQAG